MLHRRALRLGNFIPETDGTHRTGLAQYKSSLSKKVCVLGAVVCGSVKSNLQFLESYIKPNLNSAFYTFKIFWGKYKVLHGYILYFYKQYIQNYSWNYYTAYYSTYLWYSIRCTKSLLVRHNTFQNILETSQIYRHKESMIPWIK